MDTSPQSSSRISSSPPSPVALTLRRRQRDEQRRLQEQYSLGRPPPWLRLCGNEDCSLRCCTIYETSRIILPLYLLGDNEQSEEGIPVKDILTEFAHLVTTRVWSSIEKQSDVLLQARSVEAFASSPPVRAAYLDFRLLCEKNDVEFTTESRLRQTLSETMSQFRDLINILDMAEQPDSHDKARMIHRTLQPPQKPNQKPTDKPRPWTQEDCIMRFLLTIELWRRQDETHMRQRNWTWEEPWIMAELLSAVLLHYWLLDMEKCFARVPCRGSEQYDEVWQDWLDKYPLLEDSDHDQDNIKSPDLVPKPIGLIKGLDLDKDIGYVGGVGTAARGPLWIDRRQRHEDDDDDGLPQH